MSYIKSNYPFKYIPYNRKLKFFVFIVNPITNPKQLNKTRKTLNMFTTTTATREQVLKLLRTCAMERHASQEPVQVQVLLLWQDDPPRRQDHPLYKGGCRDVSSIQGAGAECGLTMAECLLGWSCWNIRSTSAVIHATGTKGSITVTSLSSGSAECQLGMGL